MKLSKFNNILSKNSMFVLLFVICSSVLIGYSNVESFTDFVEQTTIQPIIQAPVFNPYTESSKTVDETKPTTETDTKTATTSAPQNTNLPTHSTSKSDFYLLILFVVSMLIIVLLIWGYMMVSHARTVNNISQ
jgi:hypothetical protein